jgi:predicted cupin superfamily sugar epimerase
MDRRRVLAVDFLNKLFEYRYMQDKINALVSHLNLQPHPEGGYYKEVYRSAGSVPASVLGEPFNGDRSYCTSIYFMLTSDTFSALHRINQDEMWHFYQGSSLSLHIISPEGNYQNIQVGHDFNKGEVPQVLVPADHWFGATVNEANSFSLVGCTVSPGFDFADFELGDYKGLCKHFPQHEVLIKKLTRT